MIAPHSFVNIGSRNKAIMWEYLAACAYRDLVVPGSAYKLTKQFSFGEGESNQHCLALSEIESNTKLMIEEFESGIYTDSFFKRVADYYKKPLEDFKGSLRDASPEKLTNEELIGVYSAFHHAAGCTYPPMLIGFFAAYLDDYFTTSLKAVVPVEGVELVMLKAKLLTIPKLGLPDREEDAISKVVRQIKTDPGLKAIRTARELLDNQAVRFELNTLARDYGWFHMEYAQEPYTEEYYADVLAKRLQPDVPVADMVKARQDAMREQSLFFTKYDDKRLKGITVLMQELGFILNESKEVTVENHYLVYPYLKEMAKRLSIELKDIYYLSGEEIIGALKRGSVSQGVIDGRKKYRALLLSDGVIDIFAGEEAKKAADEYIKAPEVESPSEVKGLVAYPGVYRGKVSVVLDPNNYGTFKDGDVLVTRDGSAEFTSFLQRAGAIVTDQGGVISHVAIVAREYKKVSVLSTKVATKIFKDGDMVEVDAEKGIVRKI